MPCTIYWEEDDGSIAVVSLDIYEEETYSWDATVTKHPVETGGVVTDGVQLLNPTLVISGYVSNKPLPSNDLLLGTFTKIPLVVPDQPEYKFGTEKLEIPDKPFRANLGALVSAGFDAIAGKSEPTATVRKPDGAKTRNVSAEGWQLDDKDQNRAVEVLEKLRGLWFSKKRCEVVTDLVTFGSSVVSNITVPRKTEDGEGAPFSISFEQIRTVFAVETDAPQPAEALVQRKKASGSKAVKDLGDEKKKLRSLAFRGFAGLVDPEF